ncbi:15423_t:CDS:2 [Cetraspora pellucida]|uniref:15423_t:CDS:1 n=1 Tax=Cetraspora pellucida TaxID=1433469 RepID=A0A9N9I1S9_9GLOM|nr:15423_t:CDS:2 [Cetraspora pellucida]
MARGNQREKAREKNQKKQQKVPKKKEDGVTFKKRAERRFAYGRIWAAIYGSIRSFAIFEPSFHESKKRIRNNIS